MATEPRPGEEKASGGPSEMGSWRRLLQDGFLEKGVAEKDGCRALS